MEELDVQKEADAASAEEALNMGETAVNGKVLKDSLYQINITDGGATSSPWKMEKAFCTPPIKRLPWLLFELPKIIISKKQT